MTKPVIYSYCEDNHYVIDYYLDIVTKSLILNGYDVKEVKFNDSKTLDKKNYILVVTSLSLFKWYIKGFRNFIFWSQGVAPEEVLMKHNSKLKYYILNYIEKFSIKKAKFLFFVSEYQKIHFSKKYNLNINGNYYIMPCFNCDIEDESFFNKNKYSNNVFCYIGSLAKWQYFPETMDVYKKIEETNINVSLKIFTFNVEEANAIVKSKGIENFSIEYVEQIHLPKYLAECKYGFLLREDNIVNNVATPTKLSTYLSNGIIPIISNTIYEYNKMLENYTFKIVLDNNESVERVNLYNKLNIDSKNVYNEYKSFFEEYYNKDRHIENISKLLASNNIIVK